MIAKFEWFPCYQGKMLDAYGKIERQDDLSFYFGVICLIYEHRVVLGHTNKWIGRQLNRSERSAANSRARLVNLGLLVDTAAGLLEPRAMVELEKQNVKSENRSSGREKVSKSRPTEQLVLTKNQLAFDRECSENPSRLEREDVEKSQFASKINEAYSQLNVKSPEREKERENIPPLSPPEGASTRKSFEEGSIGPKALETYNVAAAKHGWQQARMASGERVAKLRDRVIDIGGLDNFKRCLNAIVADDFLMGRVPGKPFRMNLNILLSTEGKLGLLLERLFDQSAPSEDLSQVNGVTAVTAKIYAEHSDDLAFWRRMIETEKPNGLYPKILGVPPGHEGCPMSRRVQDEMGLIGRYNADGTFNGKH